MPPPSHLLITSVSVVRKQPFVYWSFTSIPKDTLPSRLREALLQFQNKVIPYLTHMTEGVSVIAPRNCHLHWGREGPHLIHGSLNSQFVGCGQIRQSWMPKWKKGLDTDFQKMKLNGMRNSERKIKTYLSSSGGGSGGPRPSSDLKDDGCPGDRGNEALLSDVDLNRIGTKVKGQELLSSLGLLKVSLVPRSP